MCMRLHFFFWREVSYQVGCGCGMSRFTIYLQGCEKKAVVQHCKEDGVAIYPLIDSLGREQQAKFINEGNVYRLITHSKLPGAVERFVIALQ